MQEEIVIKKPGMKEFCAINVKLDMVKYQKLFV